MASGRFCFFIPGHDSAVQPGTDLWHYSLSGNGTGPVSTSSPQLSDFSIGDYFEAAAGYLSQNNFSDLYKALEAVSKKDVRSCDIGQIDLFLEKHGVFYRPLKVSVHTGEGKSVNFVLNGAVSPAGLALVETEYRLISRLNEKFKSEKILPRVYGSGIVQTNKQPVGFFLGQWFDGFMEFHVTLHNGEQKVAFWKSDGRLNYFSISEALPVYHEIARALTCFYDLETFEQIFPWHHAAGDFIAVGDTNTVSVKLVTARGYAPLTGFDASGDKHEANILPSLLLFFVHLTVRMRLDRLDGTGKLVFLDERVVKETVNGFLKALEEKAVQPEFQDISNVFLYFSRQFASEQLIDIVQNLTDAGSQPPGETELIMKNCASHCRVLHAILKNM